MKTYHFAAIKSIVVNKAGLYMLLCMNIGCIDVCNRNSNGICVSNAYSNGHEIFIEKFL